MSKKRLDVPTFVTTTNEEGRRLLEVAGSKVDTQCAWNDHGVRCQRGGSQSDATNGFGPWYCRVHYRRLNGWPEREEPETAEQRNARRMAKFAV
jgi:hypothetical protein